MAPNVQQYNFTTGPSSVPEITNDNGAVLGQLNYNGCTFSPLFVTEVSGVAVEDEARRTVKYMEYNITADGYVTLPDGAVDINPNMTQLRNLLTAQGGSLVYKGRGMDLVVNGAPGAAVKDVAWGPTPRLLEFQPLGAGRSAKVKWQVVVRLPEITQKQVRVPVNNEDNIPGQRVGGAKPQARGAAGGIALLTLLQFNYETVVTYSEDFFSSLSIRGTLEIPMTRLNQKDRTVQQTADAARAILDDRIMSGVDLTKFKPVRRNFSLSRDKRTLEWDFQFDERPYMDTPPDCSLATGNFTVRPAKAGMGLCLWLCTLRATYTVHNRRPRRTAWLAFLALLRLRMMQAENQPAIPNVGGGNQNPFRNLFRQPPRAARGAPNEKNALDAMNKILEQQNKDIKDTRHAWLIDFNVEEGIYQDSKMVSFSATWRMVCTFSHILIASGVWKKVPEEDAQGKNLWSLYMSNVSGSKSWLENKADASRDIIVDFGGG